MNDKRTGKNESTPGKITLVIPAISDLFCMSIRFLVQEIRDIQIIMVESDCRKIRNFLDTNSHCIVVTTSAWLGKSGACEVKELMEAYPGLRILMYLKAGEFPRAVSLFQAGIQGFFSDSITCGEFHDCLAELWSGKSFFSQDIIPVLLSREPEKINGHGPGNNLTAREHEILVLIEQGYTNKEIASKLCLSPRTIEGHRASLILKFGVRNTAELVSEALNLLEPAV